MLSIMSSCQVALAGYPNMGNMSVVAGKKLLDMLAEDSDEAQDFRRFVMRQSTTFVDDSDDRCVSPNHRCRYALT